MKTFAALPIVVTLFVCCSDQRLDVDTPMPKTEFETLDECLHSTTKYHEALETEFLRDPYHEAIVFTSGTDLDTIIEWYSREFSVRILERDDYDPGQATLYFDSDSKSRDVSVCLADTSIPSAVDNLFAYVPTPQLKSLSAKGERIVGIVFMEDVNRTIQRMKDNGEWPPG